MDFGLHWGLWAMAIVALIVGLFLILRSRRNKKWNWAAAGVLALLLAVGMFARGWTVWPKQTAEHFISVVYDGQHDEAKEMLSEPRQWTITDDGSVTILAEDSTKATLSPDDLPLVVTSADVSGVPVPMQDWGEFMAGKIDFQLGSFTKKDVIVGCTAEQGAVRIRHVEVTMEPEAPKGEAIADLVLREAREQADAILAALFAGKLDEDQDMAPVAMKVKGYQSWSIKSQHVVRDDAADFRGMLYAPGSRVGFHIHLVKQGNGNWAIGAFGLNPE